MKEAYEPGESIEVDIKLNVKGTAEPKLFCFNYRNPVGQDRTGLEHSWASVSYSFEGPMVHASVQISEYDSGKILFLYVVYQTGIYQLIQITKRPVTMRATPSSLPVVLFNMQLMTGSRTTATLTEQCIDFACGESCSLLNSYLVPLTQEVLLASDFCEALKAKEFQLETLDCCADSCLVFNLFSELLSGNQFTPTFKVMIDDVNNESKTNLSTSPTHYSVLYCTQGVFFV